MEFKLKMVLFGSQALKEHTDLMDMNLKKWALILDYPQCRICITIHTKNIMYFASPTKFITFDGKEFKVFTEKEGYKINGLEGQLVTFVRADSKGRIWIGSVTPFVDKNNNGGLTKFESGKFTVYDSKNFPLDNATNFIETPYGDHNF